MKFKPELPKTSGWYFVSFDNTVIGIAFYCKQQNAVYEAGHPKYHAEDCELLWGDPVPMPEVQAE